MTCLVDTDALHPPPAYLMDSGLFVLTTSSPGPDRCRWIEKRNLSQQFALNPPTQDELVQVLVRSFISSTVCSRSLVFLV